MARRRTRRNTTGIAAALLGVGLLVTGFAGASPAGASAVVPATPVLPNGQLNSIACLGPFNCTAVGWFINSSQVKLTLVEHYDGAQWKVVPSANKKGSLQDLLSGVSCVSGHNCTAVGSFENSSKQYRSLAEHWNGTKWSLVPLAVPAGFTQGGLDGVACTSATDCDAVGSYKGGSNTRIAYAEHWNGTAWSVAPAANPGQPGELFAVTCVNASNCTAVGDNNVALVEHWNGTKWKKMAFPTPSGAGFSGLTGISCLTASSCIAVGTWQDNNNTAFYTLAESWNGTSWKIVPSQNALTDYSNLRDVACKANTCVAGGFSSPAPGDASTKPISEAWDGSSFTLDATPNTGNDSGLLGVACVVATDCSAVGWYTTAQHVTATLAERWNGSNWTVVPTPNA